MRSSPVPSNSSVLMPTEIAECPQVREALGELGMATYDSASSPPPADVLKGVEFYIPPYMGVAADLALMSAMPRLQVVQLPTAGYEAALEHTPPQATLCNAGGVHDASTAEIALALVLASLRRVDDFARAMPSGQWLFGRYDALADKRVLIIGAGGVGRAVARRLEPFEVEVTLVARSARDDVRPIDELPDLLTGANVVVLALPLTPETTRIADAAFLARMRPGALLVNVGRGGLVDTEALVHEVTARRLRAALDVTDPEPLPADHPLWRAPGVLISPHVGGNTSAFLPRMRRKAAAQIRRWRAGEPVEDVVRGPLTTLGP